MPERASAPAQEFDLIVIGAGSGNSLIGPEFAEWNVALIDDGEWFGGTCLNAGCIPTKMFVRVADVATDAVDGERLGLSARIDPVNWPLVRDRVFAKTDKISRAGFRYRDQKSPNVTVFRESFGFEDQHTVVSASGERLHAPVIVIAAGSRPRPLLAAYEPDPAIHDSNSIMRIDALPRSLVIVGGGAVAVEFAHVFSSFGVDVTLITRSGRLLTGLDADVSQRFTELADDRWHHLANDAVEAIERVGGELHLTLASGGRVEASMVLVAHGRVPNTDTLAAASVGFDLHDDSRLVVDAQQRVLSNGAPVEGVFALGDVSSLWQLKHVANHEARVVEHNIMHPDAPIGGDPGPIPAAIFSHPQIAHFGLTEAQAETASRVDGSAFVAVTQEYRTTAYGWALEDTTSFCKLIVDADSGLLLGAHIIGPEASILIQTLVLAASHGMSVRGLARSQYWPHPAASEVVENALLKAEEALAEREAAVQQLNAARTTNAAPQPNAEEAP
ncbi:mycothione reductase [Leifsonia sp. Root112D2]|uniref:mycothione reductase n=1 Tax=Leifsonia sp. Root112D2 TaxID=1736426 RepID=UPI0009E9827B|nr:mycothione reductase [Leifsonia sp. Root112D2]